jgi:hypothetical protein
MRERFHAEPSIQATELLLQERTPRDSRSLIPEPKKWHGGALSDTQLPESRRFHLRTIDAANPSALERPLFGNADERRLRLQPLERSRSHPLARRSHAR